MNTLPASIEAYLKEAGFSLTEIIALKHLLEEDALTLRQLAAKTGKSTGVLDQAMRKLLEKNIVTKEPINENPKYVLRALDAITGWMEKDMQTRKTEMQRRYKNFEAFISSVQTGRHRPEMEFFEGLEGLSNAYRKLLDRVPLTPKAKGFFQPTARGEMLHEFPVVCSVEDDPLRDFRVQEFRERRSRGVFARFIISDTPLGRRFETRDPFEYRQSILVPEEEHPITFEKVIAGDTVGCFNHAEKRACFIRFPEFAESERQAFEREWQARMHKIGTAHPEQATSNEQREMDLSPVPNPNPNPNPTTSVPVSTRTLSGVREFFLSRTSLAFMVVFALVAAGLTYSLYRHNVYLNTQRIRERAMAIASTAALQFDPADLEKLRGPEDIQRSEYKRVVYLLNLIRKQNEDIVQFAYIMRPTEKQNAFAFVADADSLNPRAIIDLNSDGQIDKADALSSPGDIYEHDNMESFNTAYFTQIATADKIPVTDSWGIFLTGVAPITKEGKSVAVLGVDILASRVYDFTRDTFHPFLTFLGLFLLFILIRLTAFNRSLLLEIVHLINIRAVTYSLTVCTVIALIVTYGFYRYTLRIMKDEIGQRLMSIAATAAPEIDSRDLEPLRFARDMKRPEYQRVFQQLNETRDRNQDVTYVYIFRPTETGGIWEFVADADSNYFLPENSDINNDQVLNEEDENIAPGVRYDVSVFSRAIESEGLLRPTYEKNFVVDQWGTFLTGSAPIVDKTGRSVGILGVDTYLDSKLTLVRKTFRPLTWFFLVTASVLVIEAIQGLSRKRDK